MTKSRALLVLPVLAVLAAGAVLASGFGAGAPTVAPVTETRVANETAEAANGAMALTNWQETSGSPRRR